MKKGMGPWQMVILIGMVMLLTVMLFFFKGFREKTELVIGDQVCINSVRMHSLAGYLYADDLKGKIHCPPKDILIEEDLDTPEGQRRARQEIGLGMASCAKNYLRGDADLFTEEGIFCGICNWIEFEDKGKYVGHFKEYLAMTELPAKIRLREGLQEGTTIADYIAKTSSQEFAKVFNNPEYFDAQEPLLDEEIDTNDIYSTVFVYFRGEEEWNEFQDFLGGQKTSSYVIGSYAGTEAALGTLTLSILLFSNPVGWATIGVAVTVGAVVGGVVGVYNYFSKEPPQTGSFVTFRKYEEGIFGEFGCEEMIAALEE